MDTITVSDLLHLSVAERLQLVEDLWDSIAAETKAAALSSEQREELDRRIADAEKNPGTGRTWPEVRSRLLGGE